MHSTQTNMLKSEAQGTGCGTTLSWKEILRSYESGIALPKFSVLVSVSTDVSVSPSSLFLKL